MQKSINASELATIILNRQLAELFGFNMIVAEPVFSLMLVSTIMYSIYCKNGFIIALHIPFLLQVDKSTFTIVYVFSAGTKKRPGSGQAVLRLSIYYRLNS